LARHISIEQHLGDIFMTKKNQPVHRIRYGAVSVSVWENDTLAGNFFSTSFRRVFKKPDDTWSETDSFDDRDLPALAKAAADAHSWIHAAKQNAATEETAEEIREATEDLNPTSDQTQPRPT
jgi:hypothetical protein